MAMTAEQQAAYDAWMKTRPECVQSLAKEFPHGQAFIVGGRVLHLLGYTENDMLIVTETWPGADYAKANATKEYICAQHVRDAVRPHDPALCDTVRMDAVGSE